MTDRELLEAAAKATGRTVTGWITFGDGGAVLVAALDDGSHFAPLHENPVTDCMGDALRLALALNMRVGPPGYVWLDGAGGFSAGLPARKADPMAATRRCITRAAAALSGDAGGVR